MKKLLIITCLLTFVSCETETVTLSKDEYNKLKGVKKSEYPKPYKIYGDDYRYNWQIILGEDDHEYLENDGDNVYALIHFPSCKKCYHFDN